MEHHGKNIRREGCDGQRWRKLDRRSLGNHVGVVTAKNVEVTTPP